MNTTSMATELARTLGWIARRAIGPEKCRASTAKATATTKARTAITSRAAPRMNPTTHDTRMIRMAMKSNRVTRAPRPASFPYSITDPAHSLGQARDAEYGQGRRFCRSRRSEHAAEAQLGGFLQTRLH